MKIKIFILIVAILALSACVPAARAEQPVNTSAPAAKTEQPANTSAVAATVAIPVATQAEATDKIEATCFRYSEETQLLINLFQGYCLQYPIGYDIAFPNETQIMLVKRSILNPEDPMLMLVVDPANGRTVEQVADQIVADYSVPGLEVKRVALEIDQEQAIMVDGLTGQSINRQVVVVHNDRVYHMTIMPMEGSPDVNAQAKALYNMVIQSFNFRPETNLCQDCPPASETP